MSVEGRQAFGGGTSRISREAYVRFCEGLGVQVPGATRRQHGDQGMPSNWRNRPRPSAKALEQGRPYNRLPRESGRRRDGGGGVRSSDEGG